MLPDPRPLRQPCHPRKSGMRLVVGGSFPPSSPLEPPPALRQSGAICRRSRAQHVHHHPDVRRPGDPRRSPGQARAAAIADRAGVAGDALGRSPALPRHAGLPRRRAPRRPRASLPRRLRRVRRSRAVTTSAWKGWASSPTPSAPGSPGWASSGRTSMASAALQKEIVAASWPLGYPPDDDRFHPHVTLGRLHVRRGGGPPPGLNPLLRHYLRWAAGRFPGRRSHHLLLDDPAPEGPTYTPLARAPLGGGKTEASP